MQYMDLPAPTQVYETYADQQTAAPPPASLKPEPPPYGRRQGFVPRTADDFGDGGAFPEIHVAQYPLDLGRPNKSSSCTAIVPLKVGADGEVQYDGILQKGGGGKTFSKFTDLVPKEFDQVRNKPRRILLILCACRRILLVQASMKKRRLRRKHELPSKN
jgi:hypothetical protein